MAGAGCPVSMSLCPIAALLRKDKDYSARHERSLGDCSGVKKQRSFDGEKQEVIWILGAVK